MRANRVQKSNRKVLEDSGFYLSLNFFILLSSVLYIAIMAVNIMSIKCVKCNRIFSI